jgi:hypothetical protein
MLQSLPHLLPLVPLKYRIGSLKNQANHFLLVLGLSSDAVQHLLELSFLLV